MACVKWLCEGDYENSRRKTALERKRPMRPRRVTEPELK